MTQEQRKAAIGNKAIDRCCVEAYNWTSMTAKELVDSGRLMPEKAATELSNELSEQDFADFGIADMDCTEISACYVQFKEACLARLTA